MFDRRPRYPPAGNATLRVTMAYADLAQAAPRRCQGGEWLVTAGPAATLDESREQSKAVLGRMSY